MCHLTLQLIDNHEQKYINFYVNKITKLLNFFLFQSKSSVPRRGEYNVYSTFQSHEPEFDYLKSLEIEEKINKIRWLRRKNQAHFLLSTNDKTIKLWKVSERDKRVEGYNTKEENGQLRDPSHVTSLRVIEVLFLITHIFTFF